MNSEQVKQLQRQLNAKGANLKVDGVLGPLTKAAMEKFSTNVTQPGATMTTEQIKALQTDLNSKGANLVVDGILGPKTLDAMNKAVTGAVASNPDAAYLVSQNDPEAIVNAYNSGDWSGITDVTGKPFSNEEQQAALSRAQEALRPGFEQERNYDTAGVSDKLASDQADYTGFLKSEAKDFGDQKNQIDQNAVDNGVLFAGSRIQKQNDLKTLFADREAAKRAQIAGDITSTARDYQYKYGDKAAGTLSDYFNLPSQTYNAGVAGGKVTRSPLSSVYNTGQNSYYGTANASNMANAQVRAAGLLANRTNKLVPYGYKNQF